ATPEFPLALLSPASPRTINSTLGDLDRTPLWCALAPTDAAARGIAPGDRIRVFNARSELTALARIDDALRPGVCVIPKGVWLRNTREGRGPNALIPADVTPATGGATYNDARVQVARAG
ncbi:MAG TPA: molybdopterin dinucleotide binding domain-containing protein, partial [Planctomycetota bacterium]|nr:molybdopterin dinucleotide binding domain-containing protein [Planctomycetota bacterium]